MLKNNRIRQTFILGLIALGTVAAQTANDYKVTSLPGIDVNSLEFSQYAGHIKVSSETDSSLFFWMIESEEKLKQEKLIIWLNGGPGCSSMDGLFLENGPFRVRKDLTLEVNPGGWQNYATNIFVDQPAGTGFSPTNNGFLNTMTEVTDEFVVFLDSLLEIFPNLKEQELYIAGESFAGTYIPYFASRLIELNKEQKKYNLHGIAIGNGWIAPKPQYDAFYDFAIQKNLLPKDRVSLMSTHLEICHQDLKIQEKVHVSSCETLIQDIIDASIKEDKNGKTTCINTYDIRLTEEPYPDCGMNWPYELPEVSRYLRLAELKSAVHATDQKLGWRECSPDVSSSIKGDTSKPADKLLPGILKEIPVLLYSGEQDLICNYLGTEYMISNMTWNGERGFTTGSKKEEWKIDNKLAGYYTQGRNLTYVLIKDGSHMVPYDKPMECLDMINRFINVGDNTVKGMKSQVGNSKSSETTHDNKEEETTKEEEEVKSDEKEGGTAEKQQEEEPTTVDDKWSKYYNWGTGALIAVILFALSLCCCWYQNNHRTPSATAEFGGAPQRQREGVKKPGLLSKIKNMVIGRSDGRKKLRLDDNDETNELDELVIETPTLFEADGFSDDETETPPQSEPSQTRKQQTTRFAIADDEDDDFDDFADWDEGESLTTANKKKDSKSH
ncbi:hypothetical protein K501DRAFT_326853, partial [Backusella circina FSU 941]